MVGFSVPLVYTNVPKGLTIQDQQVEEVYVRVRGAQEMFNFLDTGRLHVVIDLKEAKAGSQRYYLSAKNINLPPSLQLVGVNPTEINFRLREQPATPNGDRR